MGRKTGEEKLLEHIAAGFGAELLKIAQFADKNDKPTVCIAEAADSPVRGVTSFATVGLSAHPFHGENGPVPFRLELIGCCESGATEFGSALSTAATCIFRDSWPCYPDALMPDIIGIHQFSTTMKHVLFMSPFLWNDRFRSIKVGGKTVVWLQMIPISEKELQLAEREGVEALKQVFIEKQIDVFDIERPSVV